MSETKLTTIIWLALILLTLISAGISHMSFAHEQLGKYLFILIALGALTIKGQLIVDYFMELKHVKPMWRVIMSAYCVVISLLIFIIYAIWA